MQAMTLSVLIAGVAFSTSLSAGDPAAGKVKAEVACQTCHGLDGVATIPTAPHISGQQPEYTRIQLEAYRSGQRTHPQMSIISQSLSDEEIEDLAAWYGSIKITIEMPE